MLMLIALAINVIVLFMVFGIYSKLDELSAAIKRSAPPTAAVPAPPPEPTP